jgi:hypothetical protein
MIIVARRLYGSKRGGEMKKVPQTCALPEFFARRANSDFFPQVAMK